MTQCLIAMSQVLSCGTSLGIFVGRELRVDIFQIRLRPLSVVIRRMFYKCDLLNSRSVVCQHCYHSFCA